jgi:peroxiredoxin
MESNSIKPGDVAPDFVLNAANADGQFTLASVLQRGPVILEFLRGTW